MISIEEHSVVVEGLNKEINILKREINILKREIKNIKNRIASAHEELAEEKALLSKFVVTCGKCGRCVKRLKGNWIHIMEDGLWKMVNTYTFHTK